MSTSASRTGTRPPNSLSHGLTSRWWAEGWRVEAKSFALELVGEAAVTPEILETAEALAMEIILVEASRCEKIKTFANAGSGCSRTRSDGDRRGRAEVGKDDLHLAQPGHTSATDATHVLRLATCSLRRLDELERKALSRRNRLMTRLDFLILEEQRRRAG